MMRASASFLAAFSILTLFATTPSHAADAQFCDAYANEAFEAAKQNVEFNCGFQGPRWLADVNGHRLWCSIASEAQANAETSARVTELATCTCNWYADTAKAQVDEAKQRNCGFSGLRWIDSRQGHYDWCSNFKPGLAAMQGEIDTRQFKLDNEC